MNVLKRNARFLMAAGLTSLALTAAAGAQLSVRPYHYSYFKESVPLSLDLTRVAVMADPRQAGERDNQLVTKLASFDVNPASLRATAWGGLSEADTPGWAREDATLRNLVSAMGREGVGEFISPVFLDATGGKAYVTPDLIVALDPALPADKAAAFIAANIPGVILDHDWSGMTGVYRVRTDLLSGFDVLELANRLAAMPEVRMAEPDMVMTLRSTLTPDDPLFNDQWGLRNTGQFSGTVGEDIKAVGAWDIQVGQPDIIVVVLDVGVQQNHPDINQIPGADFTSVQGVNGGPGNICDRHGTTVAGCVSAIMSNWIGITGVAPGCKTASARIASSDTPVCNGTALYSTTGMVDALQWALDIGAEITVNSNVFPSQATITMKYDQTRQAGLLHFASSGNNGIGTVNYPASLPSVLAVGAVNSRGQRWASSNFGSDLDLVAPGVQIRTTDRTGSAGYASGDYALLDGTSYAAPYAAGVAALVMSRNPDLPTDQIENILRATAVDKGSGGPDAEYGHGMVNALAALQATPPPIPPGPFNLITPANGASNISTAPLFDWSDSSNVVSYRVTIDNNSDFSSPLFDDLTTTSSIQSQPNTLAQGVTYYWRVTATNYSGTTSSSPASAMFTVSAPPPPPPGAFSLLTPSNNAVDVSRNPLLDWSDSSGAATYTVTVDTDSNFTPPAVYTTSVAVSQAQLPANTLAAGTVYFWRVVAANTNGNTASSPASRTFTTAAPPPPCPGDTNGDRRVDNADLSVLLGQFNQNVPVGTGADFNADGRVDNADLSIFLSRFNQTC